MNATAVRLQAIARDILIAEGAQAVSMRRVAAAAGVTPMTIYRHFANREALLHNVAEACFAEIGQRQAKRRKAVVLRERVKELLDEHLDFALGQPRLYDFVFTEWREGARQWPDDFRSGGSPSMTPVAQTMRAGIDSGELEDGDEWEMALMFAAMLHGLVSLHRGGRIAMSNEDFRNLCHSCVERMLHGFRA